MPRIRTDEELLLSNRARELQKECAARGEKIGYQKCLGKAAQEQGEASYEAALANARLAELLAFVEQFGAFADQFGEAAKVHQRIVQKSHEDTVNILAASEVLLQHAAERRDIVGQAEEAWQLALANFPELRDEQATSS